MGTGGLSQLRGIQWELISSAWWLNTPWTIRMTLKSQINRLYNQVYSYMRKSPVLWEIVLGIKLLKCILLIASVTIFRVW